MRSRTSSAARSRATATRGPNGGLRTGAAAPKPSGGVHPVVGQRLPYPGAWHAEVKADVVEPALAGRRRPKAGAGIERMTVEPSQSVALLGGNVPGGQSAVGRRCVDRSVMARPDPPHELISRAGRVAEDVVDEARHVLF